MKRFLSILFLAVVMIVGFKVISNQKVGYDVLASATSPSISLVSKTTTSITVSWVRLSGASGYTVYCDLIKNNATPITATSYTISGLTANKSYSIQVSAWHEGSEGSKSNTLSVTTNPETSSVISAVSSQAISSSVAVSSSTAVSSSKISSSNSSSKSSTTQAGVSSEPVSSSQAVSSNDTITEKSIEVGSEITIAKASNQFSFTDMSFWLPAGIVLILILSIIILLIVTRKKSNRL